MWTVPKLLDQFGEDVLRDVCRDINDLICGKSGYGVSPNRIGIPDEMWRRLLRYGGYRESGADKILAGEMAVQADTEGPFTPYTIHTLVNLDAVNGGPLTTEELNQLLSRALSYRQLIEDPS